MCIQISGEGYYNYGDLYISIQSPQKCPEFTQKSAQLMYESYIFSNKI